MVQGKPIQELNLSIMATSHIEQRLNTYKNNYFGGLVDALKITYPQVLSLVGEAFFQQLANDYITHHPMNKGNHQQYGANFNQHIALLATQNKTFEKVLYLADVAKSDWAMYLSYYAAKRPVFDFASFSQLDSNAQQKAILDLADDVHLLSSQWPLSQLWQLVQNSIETFQLKQSNTAQGFVVYRLEHKPQLELLSEKQHCVLHAIIHGVAIEDLPESSSLYLPEFITNGWITGYQA